MLKISLPPQHYWHYEGLYTDFRPIQNYVISPSPTNPDYKLDCRNQVLYLNVSQCCSKVSVKYLTSRDVFSLAGLDGSYIKLESQFERQRTTAMKDTQLGVCRPTFKVLIVFVSSCDDAQKKKKKSLWIHFSCLGLWYFCCLPLATCNTKVLTLSVPRRQQA